MPSVMCEWSRSGNAWSCGKCGTTIIARDGDETPVSLCPRAAKDAGVDYSDAGRLLPSVGESQGSISQARISRATEGPGTELKNILSSIGITASGNCSCNSRASLMNVWGEDVCEARADEIIEWLRHEASQRNLPFFEPVARLILKRAISNSRRRKRKLCQKTTDSPLTEIGGSGGTAT